MKRLKAELPEEEYKLLKNVMWILRKHPNELTEEEQQTLTKLFEYSRNSDKIESNSILTTCKNNRSWELTSCPWFKFILATLNI